MIVRGADFVQEPVKNLVLEEHASPPTNVKRSYVYFDTSKKQICVWDGAVWRCSPNIGDGQGGTTDYTLLQNKPSIASVELVGNKTFSQLGLKELTEQEITSLF